MTMRFASVLSTSPPFEEAQRQNQPVAEIGIVSTYKDAEELLARYAPGIINGVICVDLPDALFVQNCSQALAFFNRKQEDGNVR